MTQRTRNIPLDIPLGPVITGLQGVELSSEEREILLHPLLSGVILFSRNYQSPEQLVALTASIHALRNPPLLVAVDQEGGRVQRFREGFTVLPALRQLGEIYDTDKNHSRQLVHTAAWLMAAELRALGIDFSFAPVLDLYDPASKAIGNRAFHANPQVVIELAQMYITGMKAAGMASVGKHFPGHGTMHADSHTELPTDERDYDAIAATDLLPFSQLIRADIDGIMPAHIVYPKLDNKPACFSAVWLRNILRQQLGFTGIVFSDDLGMNAAATIGDPLARATAALQAGCDVVLSCNEPAATEQILDNVKFPDDSIEKLSQRLLRYQAKFDYVDFAELRKSARWQQAARQILAC